MFPKKLYVEVTTRCNMQCGMCVKHAPDSCISNTDMAFSVFSRLRSSLPYAEELILNGIGEPMLHSDIVKMVSFAAQQMPTGSYRGFQTNGLLLTRQNTEELIDAGLNKLCISADAVPDNGRAGRNLLHGCSRPSSPLALVDAVRQEKKANIKLGAEVVLVRETVQALPELIRQLAEEGVDFVIGSHLLSYLPDNESHSLFDTNTTQARELYSRWKQRTESEGISLASLTSKTWIAPRLNHDHHLKGRYEEMLRDAREEGIWLHVKRLEEWDTDVTDIAEEAYHRAEDVARRYGVALDLPPLTAAAERSCRFITDRAVFIDTEGEVMPCHALWHDYTIYMNGDKKRLHRRSLGNISENELPDIWQSSEYREFRDEASRYEYPFCHSCTPGPCPDITGELSPFVNDCFGIDVPCGHCLWCLDAVRCL